MRYPAESVTERRKAPEATFLVTGATGFLGSHIAGELLRRGYELVLLCRPKGEVSAKARVIRLLSWLGLESRHRSRARVVEGSVDRPRFGLDEKQYERLISEVHDVFHCAADTSFADRHRERIEAANITGAQHVMEFAKAAGGCSFIHHISTAYVAGKREGHCPEAWEETSDFHNVYEETKYGAEQLLLRDCREGGIRLNIYRPSIVYGDSTSGRTFRFNALYYPVKVIHYLQNLYLRDIHENGGKYAAQMGVSLDGDGTLSLPIRVERNPRGILDVIPVDFFVRAVMAIMDLSLDGGIFHIVSDRGTSLEKIIDFIQRFFRISGIETRPAKSDDEDGGDAKTPLEVLVDGYLDVYRPYMMDTRKFDHDRTASLLRAKRVECPELDYPVFERCMRYALATDWGRRISI